MSSPAVGRCATPGMTPERACAERAVGLVEVAEHQGRAVVLDEGTQLALAAGSDVEMATALARRLDLGRAALEALADRREGQVAAALYRNSAAVPRELRRVLLSGRTRAGELTSGWQAWRVAPHDQAVAAAGDGLHVSVALDTQACCARRQLEADAAVLRAARLHLVEQASGTDEVLQAVSAVACTPRWMKQPSGEARQRVYRALERCINAQGRRQALAVVDEAHEALGEAVAETEPCGGVRCRTPQDAVGELRRVAAGAWAACGDAPQEVWQLRLEQMDPEVVAGLPAEALGEVCRTAPQELGWATCERIIEQREDVALGWGVVLAAWSAGERVPLRRLRLVAAEVRLRPLLEAVAPARLAHGLGSRIPRLGEVLEGELERVVVDEEHRRCLDALMGEFEGTLSELVEVSRRLSQQGAGGAAGGAGRSGSGT